MNPLFLCSLLFTLFAVNGWAWQTPHCSPQSVEGGVAAANSGERKDEFEELLRLFPAGSPYPDMLRHCQNDDSEARDEALTELARIFYRQRAEDDLQLEDVVALLEIVIRAEFPTPDWQTPNESILGMLTEMKPHQIQPIVSRVVEAYQPEDEYSSDRYLILLASSGSIEGAQALVNCVTIKGWPERPAPRIFLDLESMPDEATAFLFPRLLVEETDPKRVSSLADLLITTNRERITPEHLMPLRSGVRKVLAPLVERTAGLNDDSDEWYTEDYEAVQALIPYLKIAGYLGDPQLEELLERARNLKTVEVLRHSVVASLQNGFDVSAEDVLAVAADYDSIAYFFQSLEELGRLDLIPDEFKTWERFALAEAMPDIVHELLEPPKFARVVERVEETGPEGETWTALLWNIRVDESDEWLACISGPHKFEGQPRPLEPVQFALSQYIPWTWDESERDADIAKTRERLIEWLGENR
ncbi:MAG: hypothetical protein AAF456_11525 [Planctomycetota bacterium]